MARAHRIHYDGEDNDAAYIRFLEDRILELEEALQRSPHKAHTQRISFRESHGDLSRSNRNFGQERLHDRMRPAIASRSDRQDAEDYDNNHGCTFEVIEYKPPRNVNFHLKKRKQDARSQSAKGQVRMLSKFTSFIGDLPKSKTWQEWVSVSDSQRASLIRGLVQGVNPSDGLKVLPPTVSRSTNISILHEYSNSMKTSSTTNRQLARFRELIFCSLCAVALSTESKDEVYETMREVFGSDAYSKTFEALVRGAKWVNHAISLLSRTRWALRSWDIILVAAHQISFYARFNDFSINPERLLDALATHLRDDSYLKDTTDTSIPLAIPLIIGKIFRNSTSLEEICGCLGYTFSDVQPLQGAFNRIFHGASSSKRRRTHKQAESSKKHCDDSGFERRSDQLHQSNPKATSENDFHILVQGLPSLSDSLPSQVPSTAPQPAEPAAPSDSPGAIDAMFGRCQNPRLGEPMAQANDDDLGTSDVWFSTYPNSQPSELAAQREDDDHGTSDVWFSTYPNSQLDGPAERGDGVGMSDVWFSTYPNSQLGGPAEQAGGVGTSDVWFSTYPNSQLSGPAEQGDGVGTSDVWFSTYPNSQFSEPATQGQVLGTSDTWFRVYPTTQLGERVAQTDSGSSRADCEVPELDVPSQLHRNLSSLC